ncbi:acyltransferase [Vibrio sp. Y58_MX_L22]|uniref:acyltransferase family protein n=1 Tax=Vibrio sp. Y58_MX_L22 TaxID=2957763 RepID=UPI0020A4E9A9|nr:acyltransferase [Vibrio sp. Y58_MX_L22]
MNLSTYNKISKEDSRFFDVLRGFSAYLVVLAHVYQMMFQPFFESTLINKVVYTVAQYAVIVFFVLSGFMISNSIYRNLSSNGFCSFNIKDFVLNRLLRLYPPLIFSVLVVTLVYFVVTFFGIPFSNGHEIFLVRESFEYNVVDIFASLIFLQNISTDVFLTPSMNGPLWSLSYEFWYYILTALIVFSLLHNKMLLSLPVAFFMFVLFFGKWFLFFGGFFSWGLGFLYLVLYQNIERFSIRKWGVDVVILLFSSIVLYCLIFSRSEILTFGSRYLFSICFVLVLIRLKLFNSLSVKIFIGNPVCVFFANSSQFSYTLYIIHWPLLMLYYSLVSDLISFNLQCVIAFSFLFVILITMVSYNCSRFLEDKNYVRRVMGDVVGRFGVLMSGKRI